MAEHSPGPWTPRYSIAGPISEVMDAEGLVICEMVLPVGGIPVSDSNAHFIAAAPEMLAALEMVVDRIYDFGTEFEDLATVKAAIAKAKGEAQNG